MSWMNREVQYKLSRDTVIISYITEPFRRWGNKQLFGHRNITLRYFFVASFILYFTTLLNQTDTNKAKAADTVVSLRNVASDQTSSLP